MKNYKVCVLKIWNVCKCEFLQNITQFQAQFLFAISCKIWIELFELHLCLAFTRIINEKGTSIKKRFSNLLTIFLDYFFLNTEVWTNNHGSCLCKKSKISLIVGSNDYLTDILHSLTSEKY